MMKGKIGFSLEGLKFWVRERENVDISSFILSTPGGLERPYFHPLYPIGLERKSLAVIGFIASLPQKSPLSRRGSSIMRR